MHPHGIAPTLFKIWFVDAVGGFYSYCSHQGNKTNKEWKIVRKKNLMLTKWFNTFFLNVHAISHTTTLNNTHYTLSENFLDNVIFCWLEFRTLKLNIYVFHLKAMINLNLPALVRQYYHVQIYVELIILVGSFLFPNSRKQNGPKLRIENTQIIIIFNFKYSWQKVYPF